MNMSASITRIAIIASLSTLLTQTLFAASSPDTQSDTYTDLPWMTGPILAPAGHVVPGGHINWEPYLFVTDAFGTYNALGKVIHNPSNVTTQPMLSLTAGVTQWMDFQAIIPYSFNNKEGQSDNDWADITLMFGLQAMTDNPKSWWYPDLRITVEETFPSGHYENLNPALLGTDSTGAGSYQSSIGLNFQKVWQFSEVNYLRGRLSYTYTIAASTHVTGYNSFGGGIGTDGNVDLGNKSVVDIGLEYSLTPNWVLATDLVYNNATPTVFTGTPGLTTDGSIATTGQSSTHQYSMTPSIEYNWNASVGIIAGAWFSFAGDEAVDFAGGAIAFNYYD